MSHDVVVPSHRWVAHGQCVPENVLWVRVLAPCNIFECRHRCLVEVEADFVDRHAVRQAQLRAMNMIADRPNDRTVTRSRESHARAAWGYELTHQACAPLLVNLKEGCNGVEGCVDERLAVGNPLSEHDARVQRQSVAEDDVLLAVHDEQSARPVSQWVAIQGRIVEHA